MCIPPSLLSNGSVNTFPQQQIFAGGGFFYAVHDVSKESRQLVLSITSCLYFAEAVGRLDCIPWSGTMKAGRELGRTVRGMVVV
jgi:hypothetical protein